MDAGTVPEGNGQATLADKVAFLSRPNSYPHRPRSVESLETHMSWIFLAGDLVYKLKKPVRFSYLDFSTPERRAAACEAEMAVNHRLAPRVYLRVAALTTDGGRLAIDGAGRVVDRLVVMRRLDAARMLDRVLGAGPVDAAQGAGLAAVLARFYRHTTRIHRTPAAHLAAWRLRLAENRRVLFDPALPLERTAIARIDRIQRRFLADAATLVAARATERRLVDGHGDLRPEHIFLGPPVEVIDRLEFNPALRVCDPFDELASLEVDCTQLGFPEIGAGITRMTAVRLRDAVPPALAAFYRSYRATLRARLSIAHLLDTDCRTPEKWPKRAAEFLAIAMREANALDAATVARRRRRADAL